MKYAKLAIYLVAIVCLTQGGFAYADANDLSCRAREAAMGNCPVGGVDASIGNGAVVLRDEMTRETAGTPGSGGRGNAGRQEAAPPSGYAEPKRRLPERPWVSCGLNADRLGCPDPLPREDPAVAPTPADVVTISDLVNFRPAAATASMEPNGWMIVGLHTNFFARAAAPQLQAGELLGQPATVRFTATRFTWDYGDGTVVASSASGSSWRQQRLAEFSPTVTSHVYGSPGSYTISLTIDYAAEYQYAGSGWRTVTGTLTVPASQLVATASNARTVLVEEECNRNPSGPGC